MIRRKLGEYNALLVLFLMLPFKLLGDISSYLFNIFVPSMTIFAIPFFLIGIFLFPIKINLRKKIIVFLIGIFFASGIVSIVLNTIIYYISTISYIIILNSIITSLLMYFIFFYMGLYYQDFEKIILKVISFTLLIVGICVIFTQIYVKDVWMQLNKSGSYLRISDTYVFMLLLVISRMKSLKTSLFFAVFSFFVVFFLGSRSSLLFYIISISMYIYYCSFIIKKNIFMIFFLIISIVSPFILQSIKWKDIVMDNFQDFRIISTLEADGGGGIDTRKIFLENGLMRIIENPFTGNIYKRFYLDNTGGNYIHNILFLWDDFGILVFGVAILLILWLFIEVIRSKEYFYFMLPILFCILSMLFARAYTFPYIFLFLGIYLNLKTSCLNINKRG